ncbi:MAG: ribonuclease P protein component 4 [Thermoplasmata archaeon]
MAKKVHRKVARRRIDTLFELAAEASLSGDTHFAKRYTMLARKIGMRYNVSLRSHQKRRMCKRCYSYLQPGVNCRIRLKGGRLVTLCEECGTINRYIYKRR